MRSREPSSRRAPLVFGLGSGAIDVRTQFVAGNCSIGGALNCRDEFGRGAALGPLQPMPKSGLPNANLLGQSRLATDEVARTMKGFGAHEHRFNRVIVILQPNFRR